jgi:dTDP-4-amino-4,6-dideoxygalactose transaminase
MTSGEGGVVVCDDEDLGEWVYGILGHAGKQIDAIQAKEGRKLDGWNFRMTEFQAAILLAQLDRAEGQVRKRMDNADYLRSRFAEIEGIGAVPHSPEQNYYSFMFKYDAGGFKGVPKKKFDQALKAEGIPTFCSPGSQFPAYRSPNFHCPGQDFSDVYCPVAERAFNDEAMGIRATDTLLGEKDDMDDMVDAIVKIKDNVDELVD